MPDHGIRWAVQRATHAVHRPVLHAYEGATIPPGTVIETLCSTPEQPVTFELPDPDTLEPHERYSPSCPLCRRKAWAIVHGEDAPYPSAR